MADDAALAAAAAAVVEDLTSDEHQVVKPDTSDLMGIYTADSVAAPEPGEQPAPVEQPDAPALPSWEADLSGIEDIFDEDEPPSFDEPEPTFTASVQEPESWDDDEEKRRLKAELVKAQKQLAWQREQAAKAQLKEWRAEASRRFPFSDPESITGTSRRGVLREAARQHEAVQKKVQPLTEALDAFRSQVFAEAKEQARQEAAQAWGAPRVAPGPAQVVQAEDSQTYDRRNYRSAHDLIKAKLLGGKYGPV